MIQFISCLWQNNGQRWQKEHRGEEPDARPATDTRSARQGSQEKREMGFGVKTMSVSPAFMPGADHPAPEPFGYRPLAAIAAAGAGGVPQKRIGRVVSEIAPEVMAAHEQGKVHGAISVHTVGLDEFGYAHLMVPALYPDHPSGMEPASCFAAAEQFDADPVRACGPWTDVYALCAMMCSLVSGSPPPHALARRANDQYVPLAQRMPRGYEEAFLSVIDQGLSLAPAQRPQSVEALCGMLGVSCVPETQEDLSAESRNAATPPAASRVPGQRRGVVGDRRRRGGVLAVLAGALAVTGIWAWMNQDGRQDHEWSEPPATSASSSSGYAVPAPSASGRRDAAADAAGRATSAGTADTSRLDTDDAGRSPDPQSLSAVPAAPVATPSAPLESAAAPGGPSAGLGGTPAPAPVEAGGTDTGRPVRPAMVAVKVDVQPWGEIFVDGISRGVSPPLKTLNLAAGRHTVEVRNAGLAPYRVTIELKAGQPAAIRHVFQ
jgi:hypothetical protein